MEELYRVGVFVRGEREPSHNALEYRSVELAEEAARDLYGRWTMMRGWQIERTADGGVTWNVLSEVYPNGA